MACYISPYKWETTVPQEYPFAVHTNQLGGIWPWVPLKKGLLSFCNTIWSQYKEGNGEVWPKTPLISMLFCSWTCFTIPMGNGKRFHTFKPLWFSELTLNYMLSVKWKKMYSNGKNISNVGKWMCQSFTNIWVATQLLRY